MSGGAKPNDWPFTASTRAQRPAKIGAERLVPPTCSVEPLTTIFAPELGLPSKATSATPRCVPEANPFCQLGFGSNVDGLPPVAPLPMLRSFQTTSLFQVVVDASSFVPATAVTYCDAAGQLGLTPPSPHSSAPSSPVEIENVWPWATACEKI